MKKNHVYVVWTLLLSVLLGANNLNAREVTIAVFDFEMHSQEDLTYVLSGLSALLPSRITIPGKIAVLDQHVVNKKLTKKHPSLSEKIALARKLQADFFLTGSITKIGNTVSIDALLVDVLDQEQPSPIFIQSAGLDSLIPDITRLTDKVTELILQGPPIPDHVPDPTPPRTTAAPEKAPPEPVSAQAPDETVDSKQMQAPPTVKEETLEESEEKRPAAYQPSKSRPTAFKARQPLFQTDPYLTHAIKDQPLHVMAVGDTNGDGGKELLIAGKDKISVFTINGTTVDLYQEIKAELDENIVYIDTADINANGIDEIYVSSYEGHYANSFAVEYTDNTTYTRTADAQRWFFRVYQDSHKDKILLGQQADGTNPFRGTIYRFEWKKGALVSREEFILPGSSGIYSFTEADIDEDGSREYLSFNKGLFSSKYQLSLFSYTGRIKWKDLEKLGGSPNSFTKLLHGDDVEQEEPLPLRVICDDFDSDKRLDVVTARNSKKGKGILSKLIDYNQGEVLVLHWDGADLVPNWTSGQLQDYVTDYLLADFDNDAQKELVILSVAAEGLFGKAKNTLTFFKQNEDYNP